jgi:hypothetical protein
VKKKKMGGQLAGIGEHLTLAREYALLGNYDTALIFFEGVLAQINKLVFPLFFSSLPFFFSFFKQKARGHVSHFPFFLSRFSSSSQNMLSSISI